VFKLGFLLSCLGTMKDKDYDSGKYKLKDSGKAGKVVITKSRKKDT